MFSVSGLVPVCHNVACISCYTSNFRYNLPDHPLPLVCLALVEVGAYMVSTVASSELTPPTPVIHSMLHHSFQNSSN